MHHPPSSRRRASAPPLQDSFIQELGIKPNEEAPDSDTKDKEYGDLDKSIILPPTPPRRKPKANPYSHTHHVRPSPEIEHTPQPKTDLESEINTDYFGANFKARPYSHTQHPHSQESQSTSLPKSSAKAELQDESDAYQEESSPEEFLAELKNLPSIPFQHKKAAQLLRSWMALDIEVPGPEQTSSPSSYSTSPPDSDEEDGEPWGGEDVDDDFEDPRDSDHSGLQMSQYEVGEVVARPGRTTGSFMLRKMNGGKGKGRANEQDGSENILGKTSESDAGEQYSDGCDHSPFSLAGCCGLCGEKGRILVGTGRGGNSMQMSRRTERKEAAETKGTVEAERTCEHGSEDWMMCSECCTCGSHSAQLMKPLAEGGEELSARFEVEAKEQEAARLGKKREPDAEAARGRRREGRSTKWEQSCLTGMVLGKDDAIDEETDKDENNVEDTVREREVNKVRIAAAATAVLVAVCLWLEARKGRVVMI